MVETALLHCPVRGPLNASALAKDGLTATEEARRIDFIRFLLDRGYPEEHIAVETVVLKDIGESGRNKLRCDVIAYNTPAHRLNKLNIKDRLSKAVLVAEIKRDSKRIASAIEHQLEPALRMIPSMQVIGAYWDELNRILLTKQIVKNNVVIFEDTLSSLPIYGVPYKRKLITYAELIPSQNLVGVLFDIANIMRSHGINDEQVRYKETVKLLLARYCDERAGASSATFVSNSSEEIQPG
ncbi:type I restriction enzyme HsdR N-terminal domain-containing protein [Mesorhizobium caraganae]|uniref:Type I restriction enzyme HsdR N-terminal domain-containing protein n=1 Tax=Mesorhizobium caraganae TaxID=483206 RepID=A0ABV1Z5S0_9HYPH